MRSNVHMEMFFRCIAIHVCILVRECGPVCCDHDLNDDVFVLHLLQSLPLAAEGYLCVGLEALYTLRRLVLSVYLHIWQHAGDSGIKLTLSLGALPRVSDWKSAGGD